MALLPRIFIKKNRRRCHHRWHRNLSLRPLTVPSMTTKSPNWSFVSSIPCATEPSQKSQNTSDMQISHNASFCSRNVHTCAHFCYKMVHCGKWDWCIVGFALRVYCNIVRWRHMTSLGHRLTIIALHMLFCVSIAALLSVMEKSQEPNTWLVNCFTAALADIRRDL